MIFQIVVLILCLQCSAIWAQLDCKESDRRQDIFIDGNTWFECVRVGRNKFVGQVKRCIINDTSDIDFEYIDQQFLENLSRATKYLSRLSDQKLCDYLTTTDQDRLKKFAKQQSKRDSFAAILSRVESGAMVSRKIGDRQIDYREYIGIGLEENVEVADMDCRKANPDYRIARIESNAWIECDHDGVPKFKKCLLKKLSPFLYTHVDLDDLNWLNRQEAFRNSGIKSAVEFCESLQSNYEKAVEAAGNRVKEVSIDNLTDSNDGRQVYDITVHDNGRIYYFKEETERSYIKLKCDKTDLNKVYIVGGAVIECQKSASGQYGQTLTKCIHSENSDQFKYFTAEGINYIRQSVAFQDLAQENMFKFCNRLKNFAYDFIMEKAIVSPSENVSSFDDLVGTDKSVTWFRNV